MINKKIIYIAPILLLLFGCNAKKEDFYNLKIGDNEIVVGYDQSVDESLPIEYSIATINKKDVVNKVIYYVDDLDTDLYINDYKLSDIKETCDYFSGEYIEKNGYACIFGNVVKGHDNYVIIYSDILSDDLNQIDRVEIYYDENKWGNGFTIW